MTIPADEVEAVDPRILWLKQLLSALPVREDRRDRVDEVAEHLFHGLRLATRGTFTEADGIPVGTKETVQHLKALSKLTEVLYLHIQAMHPRAQKAIGTDKLNALIGNLSTVRKAARQELEQLRSQPEAKGRTLRAQAATRFAANAFVRLTGRPATSIVDPGTSASYGPFPDFLKALFEEYGIKAKPAGQIKILRNKVGRQKRL